jgi:hypothetical protein
MSERPDTGSTPNPSPWKNGGDGLEIKAAGKRFFVPMAYIGSAILAAGTAAYGVTSKTLEGYNARLLEVEKDNVAQSQAQQLDHALLLEIRAQLARIDARQAEIQVTLMRHGRDYP